MGAVNNRTEEGSGASEVPCLSLVDQASRQWRKGTETSQQEQLPSQSVICVSALCSVSHSTGLLSLHHPWGRPSLCSLRRWIAPAQ